MTDVSPARTFPLGVSRPSLEVDDLPTPEEVFKVRRLGARELVMYAIGPSLIALGVSIGSGEWLLGPQAVGQYGFVGIGWVITVSALLQTFYNVECARYVVATGEVPVVGWGRVPPGRLLWIPLSVFVVIFAFIAGGWAASAGQGVFALVEGRVATAAEAQQTRWYAIGLLVVVFLIAATARKISRALELSNWAMVGAILVGLLVVDLLVVPGRLWWEAIRGFVTPAAPPPGISATQLGALAGFTALASGLNWYIMGHYRDKGYGMGHRTGFLSGLRGERSELRSVGVTFPDDELNAGRWRRWYRLLRVDMWVVFFGGAMLGMLLPTVLMAQAVLLSGKQPTTANVPTFAADALRPEYGQGMFYFLLVMGVFVLFSTQLGIFEALVRIVTDATHASSPRIRALIEDDPRRFYYPFMIVLLVAISVILHLAVPVALVQWSANMSNLGALIYPFLLMYLNSRLPRAARARWWHHLFLVLNFVFFGFFFVNFIADTVGDPLVTF
ncbi:Nramp family divalent metal transporter [Pseudonocardia acaciae]|uniref:Nramp family divalent metal transporter n=1 Tax=Pseudonocardia acaciae TaxID=551276 RepID=UPI00048F3C74|nr:Nramp family divalent metal transporter [Pseudonocardia acaciae]